MTWVETIPLMGLAALIIFLPGVLIALSFKLRPHAALALAPALTVAAMLVSAVAAALIGISWNIAFVVIAAVIIAAAVFVINRLIEKWGWNRWVILKAPNDSSPRDSLKVLWQYLLGILVLIIFILPRYWKAIGDPSNIMQRWDNAFHINAIRWIAENHNGSPFSIGWMVNSSFYPIGWHDWNALTLNISHAPIAATINASYLVLIFLIWPLGMSLVLESLVKTNSFIRVAFGPLAMLFMSYPHMILEGGGLYSNSFGIGLAPLLLACIIQLTQLGAKAHLKLASGIFLALMLVAGVGLAHPNAVMAVAAMSVPMLLWTIYRSWKMRANPIPDGYKRISPKLWTIICCAAILALAGAWIVFAPGLDVAPWAQFQTIPQSIGEITVGASMTRQPIWPGSFLFVAGLVFIIARKKQLVWLITVYGVAALLYIVTTAFGVSELRNLITGVFFNDARRTGATLAFGLIPIAAIGLMGFAELVIKWGRSFSKITGRARLVLPVVLGLIFAVIIATLLNKSNGFRVQMDGYLHDAFKYSWRAETISTDEMWMLEQLPDLTDENSVIAVNPFAGGGLAYGLAGRNVTQYYMFDTAEPDVEIINSKLNMAAVDPQVCQAVHDLGVTHVLVMEPHQMNNEPDRYPGLHITSNTAGFKLVKSVGRTHLYEVNACAS